MGTIYKITNKINNKCYVGQTTQNVNIRWKQHLKPKKYKCAIYSAFQKYGINNFTFEILEAVLDEFINEKEVYYIKKFNSFNDGYNLTKGGEGIKGLKKKRKYEDIVPDLYSELKSTVKVANKLSISRITVRTILKEKGLFEKNNSSYNYKKVQVLQFDLRDNFICEYKSIAEACFKLGKTNKQISEISKCCRNKRKSAWGYKWKYKNIE